MSYLLFSLISAVAGFLLAFLFFRRPVAEVPEVIEKPVEEPVPQIVFEDVVRLVKCFDGDRIMKLTEKMKLDESNPVFHDRCQRLLRRQWDDYFAELADILARCSGQELKDLVRSYPAFSHQDIALMLMCQLPIANRTIMHLMDLNSEALKKRKLRLKAKIQSVVPLPLPAKEEDV